MVRESHRTPQCVLEVSQDPSMWPGNNLNPFYKFPKRPDRRRLSLGAASFSMLYLVFSIMLMLGRLMLA